MSVIVNTPIAHAAQTTIDVLPKSGTFDKPFKASVVIDGKGDVFNAAESQVAISSNLAVKDLTLGDCNLSYLITPSAEHLSFSGVILSGSSKKCTVYTMTLTPTAKGNATVNLSKSSVKRYGDAVDVLKSANNASFTLTGVTSTQNSQAFETKADGLYTITINIIVKDNEPLQDASVILTSPDTKTTHEQKTTQAGKVTFTKVKTGIYQATVKKGNKDVAKTIINVKGTNPNLTIGINLENQKDNPLLGNTSINILGLSPMYLASVLSIGILVGAGIALTITKLNGSKKKTKK